MDELAATEAAVRRATFLLAEAEEAAEDDEGAAAEVERCRARLEGAERRLATLRQRQPTGEPCS